MNLERTGEVALLRMNTGKANAINQAWLERMNALVDEFLASGAQALVITGYDTFFSGGLDLPGLIALDRPAMETFIEEFNATMLRLFTIPNPVVAAVNGHAIAGGCVLALQADLRLMTDRACKIGLNEVPIGLGLPQLVVETLRCQVPAPSLLPIGLEGRLLLPAEAQALGLVHEVFPDGELVERALARARGLAALPAPAFAQVKKLLRAPAIAAIEAGRARDAAGWTATWFSDAGQKRLRETVARMGAKK